MPSSHPTIDKALIGAAGVHFVASELSLRGLIALPTIRNTAGTDIIVVSKDGKWHANLQVKTSRNKVSFWPIGKSYEAWNGENNYYVFVRYLKDKERFEVFLESAQYVIKQVNARIAQERVRNLAEWAPCWYLQGEDERLRRQWLEFGD